MKRSSLLFVRPYEIAVREETADIPGRGEVFVRTACSAVSAGTELLFYRGHVPGDMRVDAGIDGMTGGVDYPLKYGYACAGEVEQAGEGVPAEIVGSRVAVLHPHESCFCAAADSVIPVPEGIPLEDAVFLPFMETAVNLVMDGEPIIGEQVAVFGQGVVGLLVTALLVVYPLRTLVTLDRFDARRARSRDLGAGASIDPGTPGLDAKLLRLFGGDHGADLVYELSGMPEALNSAIAVTGYGGRIVIGSWYGTRQAPIDLGGRFHRNRIRLISSQVSTIAPERSGRWTKQRRFETAMAMIGKVKPSRLVTHRFPLKEAAAAYRLLDERPGEALQVLLTYGEER